MNWIMKHSSPSIPTELIRIKKTNFTPPPSGNKVSKQSRGPALDLIDRTIALTKSEAEDSGDEAETSGLESALEVSDTMADQR